MSERVVLADANARHRDEIVDFLRRAGHVVRTAGTAADTLTLCAREWPDVVVVSMRLPDGSGLDVIKALDDGEPGVIALAEPHDVPTAVWAMQLGACMFLTLPVDLAHLAAAVTRVGDTVHLRRAVHALQLALDRVPAAAPAPLDEVRNAPERAKIRTREALSLRDAERRLVAGTLRYHGGNRTRAARELGISRVTLLKKIRDFGLELEAR